ncbi:Aste57867_20875 [Aphanomyces stellatus]|uniref:Aste57867_20875 protein n=1 Tax=Aphanomyces stellatus TaxID=120398 RepID=A0A485LHA6_9STRA|nr:hypothetical protein As57867_020807 [Aphanomyces stellatus]VFT97552.1 Aste57867_20875 [Aphanomyces stellatus]
MAETSRSRLNSVYALVDELSLRPNEGGDASMASDHAMSLWEKLQSNGLNDTDAWLCGALMKRLALAACSPSCKSSDHIHIIGKLSEAKQSNEIDRVYIASAQCGALRQLHCVKPSVVRPHVNTAQFIPVVRQSANLMDERKQREEVLKICRDVLIAADNVAEAEAICIEFLLEHDDAAGLRAIAIDGLLTLASRGHTLPATLLVQLGPLLTAHSADARVAALRLFRVVVAQHAAQPRVVLDALPMLCLGAMDRSAAVRREIAHAFRFFHPLPAPVLAQLLLKTPLDDGASHVPTEMLQTGVLLSLLEDQAVDVRCEASRSMVALVQRHNAVNVAALDKAITAHADLVHVGSLAAKLQITRSLATLLRCRHARGDGGFEFTPEQMAYLLADPQSPQHTVAILSAVAACALQHIHHVARVIEFLRTASTLYWAPSTPPLPAAVGTRLGDLADAIGRRAAPILELDATLRAQIQSDLPLFGPAWTSASSVARSSDRALFCSSETKDDNAAPCVARLAALNHDVDSARLLKQIQAVMVSDPLSSSSSSTLPVERLYYGQLLHVVERVVQCNLHDAASSSPRVFSLLAEAVQRFVVQFPAAPSDDLLEVLSLAQWMVVAADDSKWTSAEMTNHTLGFVRAHHVAIQTRAELIAHLRDSLRRWWPTTLLQQPPDLAHAVFATVVAPTTPLEMAVGWTVHVPVTATVYGVDDPTTLAIQVASTEGAFGVDVVPRDLVWLSRREWLVHAVVPVLFTTDMLAQPPSIELNVCVKTRGQGETVSIATPVHVGVVLSRPGRPPLATMPNASPRQTIP